MDASEFASLDQIELVGPFSTRDRSYVIRDLATGKALVVSEQAAAALRRFKHRLYQDASAQEDDIKQDLMATAKLQQIVQQIRLAERIPNKVFNPVFANFPLAQLAPIQPYLAAMARVVVSWMFWPVFAALALVCVYLGVLGNWMILDAFNNVFSIEALLTFGLLAPFLKIIHELGHILVATRFGVRLGAGGILLIGLYPIPFVDCSDADFSATRLQRILVSLAGVFADLLLGMVFFIAWFLTGSESVQEVLGHGFVFLTLNSLLFNGNPLIKLDGYFAMSDAVGHRNLASDATRAFAQLQSWLGSFGKVGDVPTTGHDLAVLLYGALSFFYRIYILGFIAYMLLPKFLGVGVFLSIWGAIAMFVVPMLRQFSAPQQRSNEEKRAMRRFRLVFILAVSLAIAFVKVPVRIVVPVELDYENAYGLSLAEAGQLVFLTNKVDIAAGDRLFQLQNSDLENELNELQAELVIANLVKDSAASDAAAFATALEQAETLEQKIQDQKHRIAKLTLVAPEAGQVMMHADVQLGQTHDAGAKLARFIPDAVGAKLVAPFPERFISHFPDRLVDLELAGNDTYSTVPLDNLVLREQLDPAEQAAAGRYQLAFETDHLAQDIAGAKLMLRVSFQSELIWQRLLFQANRLRQNFREAQLLELEKRLGGSN